MNERGLSILHDFDQLCHWLHMSKMMPHYPNVQPSPSIYITELGFADNLVVLGDSQAIIQPTLGLISLSAAKKSTRKNKSLPKLPNRRCLSTVNQRHAIRKCVIIQMPRISYATEGATKGKVAARIGNAIKAFHSFGECCEHTGKRDFIQRFSSTLLLLAPCSLIGSRLGHCKPRMPAFWMYSVIGASEEPSAQTRKNEPLATK